MRTPQQRSFFEKKGFTVTKQEQKSIIYDTQK